MREMARLSDYADVTIQKLQAKGIILTPVEIVTLNALCWDVESPESRRMLARGVPVAIGRTFLWPQTLRASDWYDRVGLRMKPRWLATAALGYSMAHSYAEGPELDAVGLPAALAVARWYMGLRCRTPEFTLALAHIIEQDAESEQPPDEDEKTMEMGEFSAALAAATGISPDFWERRCSLSYTFETLNAIAAQNQVDEKPLESDPRIRAERALGWYEEKITRRHAAEINDETT